LRQVILKISKQIASCKKKKLKCEYDYYTISGVARRDCEPEEYRPLGWS
jgi:hypothetical protein